MMDAGRHPNIEVLSNSEVIGLKGKTGNFTAVVRRNPRYVIEELCTACGDCSDACPMVVPNLFDAGLAARKAIYSPFAQAVPAAYTIDTESCLNGDRRVLVCNRCARACPRHAVDLDMQPRELELEVGSVIVATGFEPFDPYQMKIYGFGVSNNILTGLEFERLLNASGPTQGHVIRPTDHNVPKRIAFVQCVGVRGEQDCYYCSSFCCMNSVKDCLLAKDHEPDIEKLTVFYFDLRAFGKGYEEFYRRAKEMKEVEFYRAKPSKIVEDQETRNLHLWVENTLTREPEIIEADMVVLATAGRPNADNNGVAEALGIELDESGYFKVKQSNSHVLESTREGVFLAGCCKGPDDIPDCVAQATGAASAAATFLRDNLLEEVKEEIPQLDTSGPPRIGVFLCNCGINIAGVLDVEAMAEYVKTLPGVVHAQREVFLCSDLSQRLLQEAVLEHKLNRVVAAACTPRTHEPIFQETVRKVGLNPYLFEMCNVRDQCSWVHSKIPKLATGKAKEMLRMSVARAHHLEPLTKSQADMKQSALVIGGGIAGIQAALDLDAKGYEVHLVEKTDQLGGRLNRLGNLFPSDASAKVVLDEKLNELKKSKVKVHIGTEVKEVGGFVGNFRVKATDGDYQVGAVILAVGSDLYTPDKGEYGFGKFGNVFTSQEFEEMMMAGDGAPKVDGTPVKTVAFIQCVGSRDPDKNINCSRYCCPTTIKQAIHLRERGVDVIVFYRDMRTVGHGSEEFYREARKHGVVCVRFELPDAPEVTGKKNAEQIKVYENLLGDYVEVPVDAVVLAVAMKPNAEELAGFREMLKIPVSPDGFMMERHPKLGPVETSSAGIFLAGCVQGPKDIGASVSQARAAAGKANALICRETIELSPTTACVKEELCRGCGTCADICLFSAPELVEKGGGVRTARINQALCIGCGTCAAWCPTNAILARHFTDKQIDSMMEALFEETLTSG
jgi:heterodisulfide reductase subunit A